MKQSANTMERGTIITVPLSVPDTVERVEQATGIYEVKML